MNREEWRVIEGGEDRPAEVPVSAETQLRHLRNLTASMLGNALDVWSELYCELEGTVSHGVLVRPEAREGFTPKCGWPEYLEKMWVLQHYLDHVRRICEGKA